MTTPTTLVIVCCHAFYTPDSIHANPYLESNWNLKPFQRSRLVKPGEHETFIQHILAGLQIILRGRTAEDSVLVFSGGATEESLRPLSEASSYWHAAKGLLRRTFEKHEGILVEILFGRSRILLEEHATDSYQNLLFSIIEFRKAWGCYPRNIRIITHAFKAKRFLAIADYYVIGPDEASGYLSGWFSAPKWYTTQYTYTRLAQLLRLLQALHARAIRWPEHRILVQGIDPVMSYSELELTKGAEETHGYGPFSNDLYAAKLQLSLKRKQRGWDEEAFKRWIADLGKPNQGVDDDAVKALLEWQGGPNGREIFPRRLPWEDDA